ncbi:MAG TPA: stage V sporulation protein T [Syntrophothermus lipocalidus]|uniref:Transcriptional regulator, AbrB family n=1 Tax=Syntrophothermus lipocalidus (strain DSM 12680 / TGB-C1) TaxID=643648 RepID=D7CIP4_SYNLT|nr:stage V sporulation protein T [Syntrophothermus lipocalidus]ADI00909.1 transcriptional regulator, AbrB family [Syntrophothermus lipocalidus DSM 12680]HHV77239.1 stage V sporulation protein T [Syntrophothermus lipocalidus]HOV43110.1 stage V sporulation protein T [Syntrophothermus lipocalidus]
MKATGIVRRIDDLGRVVIPKEIRRTLRIREGDPLEIFVDREGEVILKKYSPIGELGDFAQEYADSLHEAIGQIALIADRDNIIAVAGAPKKEFMNKPIGPAVEKTLEDRRVAVMNEIGDHSYCKGCPVLESGDGNCKITSQVIAPIISQGDPIGAVIIMSKEPGVKMGDLEQKLAETAAGFLAKQMEQ